ncbi:hypothetical protein BT96DRAFT_997278 [Gymnopus androsaceus JB14]|uniref:Uncharacterized protein n=1 Tax=Gymnopus androsaceus JB14 TaxID=1447944 RepID=A0A6A4HC48_9AGAR|nr:hypothetical protein BT96DRAFT_997278 [Gymnopus androsaceus JB14]
MASRLVFNMVCMRHHILFKVTRIPRIKREGQDGPLDQLAIVPMEGEGRTLSTEVPINTQDLGTPNQPPVYNGSMTGPGYANNQMMYPQPYSMGPTLYVGPFTGYRTHHQYMGWESNGQTLLIPLGEVEDDMAEAKDTIHINHTSRTQVEVKLCEFGEFFRFGPKTTNLLFFGTNEERTTASALINFHRGGGLPNDVGWNKETGTLTTTGEILRAIQQGEVPIPGRTLPEKEQTRLSEHDAIATMAENATTIVTPSSPRRKLPTVSAPGLRDDDLNLHCLWMAIHGDSENSPGVIITHTGHVDKNTVLAWITIRRLWDSIYTGRLVDQSTKLIQKTNLTKHFITLAGTPDLYEQELTSAGLVIEPKHQIYPTASTFDKRREVVEHLAKCGFSMLEMERYMVWALQYACDSLNSNTLDDDAREFYASVYRQGLGRLQFTELDEGGQDRTYRLPDEFPLESVLELRRQRAEKRENRQYRTTLNTGMNNIDMVSVTESIQGMHMTN